MKISNIVLVLLAMTSVCIATQKVDGKMKQQKSTAIAARYLQAVADEASNLDANVKAGLRRLDEIKAELLDCHVHGAHCTLEATLTKKLRHQRSAVRNIKYDAEIYRKAQEIANRKIKLQARITREQAKPHPDAKKLKREHRRLRRIIKSEDRLKVRVEKKIIRRIRRLQKKEKRSQAKVQKCLEQRADKKCSKVLKAHWKRESQINSLRTNEIRITRSIVDSRKKHVKSFRKVKSTSTKKEIILNRYNIKVRYFEGKEEQLEKKIANLRSGPQTSDARLSLKKSENMLVRCHREIQILDNSKRSVRSLKPECPVGCDANLHKILNVIHINLVMKGEHDSTRHITITRDGVVQDTTSAIETETHSRNSNPINIDQTSTESRSKETHVNVKSAGRKAVVINHVAKLEDTKRVKSQVTPKIHTIHKCQIITHVGPKVHTTHTIRLRRHQAAQVVRVRTQAAPKVQTVQTTRVHRHHRHHTVHRHHIVHTVVVKRQAAPKIQTVRTVKKVVVRGQAAPKVHTTHTIRLRRHQAAQVVRVRTQASPKVQTVNTVRVERQAAQKIQTVQSVRVLRHYIASQHATSEHITLHTTEHTTPVQTITEHTTEHTTEHITPVQYN